MLAYCLFLSILCLSIPAGKSFPDAQFEYRLPPYSCSKVTQMTKQIKCAPENLLVCCGGTPSTDNKDERLPGKCLTPNGEEAQCISLYSCPKIIAALATQNPTSIQFVEKSNCGGTAASPRVCCGTHSNFTNTKPDKVASVLPITTEAEEEDKTSLLPPRSYCGYQHSDDYYRGENDTGIRITEFPWLARIIYKDDEVRCAGSLISRRYILTAGVCSYTRSGIPIAVQLGEYDTTAERDCVQEPNFEKECSQPLQILGIEKTIVHPGYNQYSDVDSIALIRLNTTAHYDDYVRPICLPLAGTKLAQVGDMLMSTGWGGADPSDPVRIKKRVQATLVANEECRRTFPSTTIDDTHMCALASNTSESFICWGDSGNPLAFATRSQWHQEGIGFYGRSCGVSNPDVYTRVSSYVDWILENIEK